MKSEREKTINQIRKHLEIGRNLNCINLDCDDCPLIINDTNCELFEYQDKCEELLDKLDNFKKSKRCPHCEGILEESE